MKICEQEKNMAFECFFLMRNEKRTEIEKNLFQFLMMMILSKEATHCITTCIFLLLLNFQDNSMKPNNAQMHINFK